MTDIIHHSTPARVLLRMLRYHATSPYIMLWRTIEFTVLLDLAARYGIDLERHVDLDVGCGNGVLGNALIDRIDIGLDTRRSDVAWARQHKPAYREVLQASATAIPLADRSQRLVFSNSVLEHIPDDAAALDEIARVLAPGGHLLLSTVSEQFPALTLGPAYHDPAARAELDHSYDHRHYYNPDTLRAGLEQRGLRLLASASYITPTQAARMHALRRWEQGQPADGVRQRVNQLRRAPLSLALLPRLTPIFAPADVGAGLAIIAQRPPSGAI